VFDKNNRQGDLIFGLISPEEKDAVKYGERVTVNSQGKLSHIGGSPKTA
jgi:hypothetical protein